MAQPRGAWESTTAWLVVLVSAATLMACVQAVLRTEARATADLLPIIVVFFALELDFVTGLVTTTVVGFIADALSGGPPGLTACGLTGSFLVLRAMVRRSPPRAPVVILALAALSYLAVAATRVGVHAVLGRGGVLPLDPWWRVAIGVALAVPVYGVLVRVSAPFRPREDVGLRS